MERRTAMGMIALVALGALALACASSEQLTKRSERLLLQGDAGRALATAEDALEKDARNEIARAALAAAGDTLLAADRRRFAALLPLDTLECARIALRIEDLRGRLARHRVMPAPDPAFDRDLRRVRDAAADGLMRAAADSVAARRPRPAYRLLEQAATFAPGRRDLDERLKRTFEQAVARIAVLPFDDRVSQPALLRPLADRLTAAVRRDIADQDLRFTRLVEPSRVYARMTVDQLGDLTRDQAVDLGRAVGANVVVWGRLHDAGTDTYTTHYREPLWHRGTERLADGTTEERWRAVDFEAVVRERVYRLQWTVQLVDTDDELTLERRDDQREVRARTVWTNFRPDDDPANYALVPPEVRTREPERAARVQKEWSATAGEWTVPRLLERARAPNVSSRAAYRREYRGEFERASRGMPVFLGSLPDAEDMAWLALRDLDGQVLALVRDLDRR